jgi:hypothetical protein
MTVWTAPSIASLKGDNTLPLQKIFKSLTEELQRRDISLATGLGLKANIASPTFTGTVSGITKAMVGLGSVDNTADTAKPVSTAQQTALNLKADLTGASFSGSITSTQITTSSLTTKDQMRLEPSNTGTSGSFITLRPATLTGSRAVTFKDSSGTVALTSDVDAVTSATRALIGSGTVSITPVANTMTSGSISWGTTLSAQPRVATSANSSAATVTHTSHTSVGVNGCTVWILRTTATATNVDAVGIVP